MPQENPCQYPQFLQWLQAIGTILASVTALIIAIFHDMMRAWVMKPKLDVSIDLNPPDCFMIPVKYHNNSGMVVDIVDTYYLRLKVTNKGNEKAENVEVFALQLMEDRGNGQWGEVNTFLPMNLVWADNSLIFYPIISPKMHRHCNLAHIIDPDKRIAHSLENKTWNGISPDKTILSFDTHAKPNTLCYLYPPGKYRLVILIAAANAKSIEKTLEIKLDGFWDCDENEMSKRGISVVLVS